MNNASVRSVVIGSASARPAGKCFYKFEHTVRPLSRTPLVGWLLTKTWIVGDGTLQRGKFGLEVGVSEHLTCELNRERSDHFWVGIVDRFRVEKGWFGATVITDSNPPLPHASPQALLDF